MDAYVFAATATSPAISTALALVSATARAVLPTPTGNGPDLYAALADADASDLLDKIAVAVDIDGLTGTQVYLAYGETSESAAFPTYGVVQDHVGFVLLTTSVPNTVSVYEAALEVSGVVGAAMVAGAGGATVLVEATHDNTTNLDSILSTVGGLTGVTAYVTARGPVSGGAGFTT